MNLKHCKIKKELTFQHESPTTAHLGYQHLSDLTVLQLGEV